MHALWKGLEHTHTKQAHLHKLTTARAITLRAHGASYVQAAPAVPVSVAAAAAVAALVLASKGTWAHGGEDDMEE